MGTPWIQEDVKQQIIELIRNTSTPLQEIADNLGITRRVVFRVIKNNFSEEFRKERKVKNYRRSKLGEKNPMSGKTKEQHHNYKGLCPDGKGYYMVLKPDWYTGRKGSKHVFYHSVVFCEHIGISEVPKGMCIHHIDLDGFNNDIENLALVTMIGHRKIHAREGATTREESRRTQESSKRTTPHVHRAMGDDMV